MAPYFEAIKDSRINLTAQNMDLLISMYSKNRTFLSLAIFSEAIRRQWTPSPASFNLVVRLLCDMPSSLLQEDSTEATDTREEGEEKEEVEKIFEEGIVFAHGLVRRMRREGIRVEKETFGRMKEAYRRFYLNKQPKHLPSHPILQGKGDRREWMEKGVGEEDSDPMRRFFYEIVQYVEEGEEKGVGEGETRGEGEELEFLEWHNDFQHKHIVFEEGYPEKKKYPEPLPVTWSRMLNNYRYLLLEEKAEALWELMGEEKVTKNLMMYKIMLGLYEAAYSRKKAEDFYSKISHPRTKRALTKRMLLFGAKFRHPWIFKRALRDCRRFEKFTPDVIKQLEQFAKKSDFDTAVLFLESGVCKNPKKKE
jgi:hypothetical protein